MNKRKIIFIDKAFQLRYAGWILGSMVVAVILIVFNSWRIYMSNKEALDIIPNSADIFVSLVVNLSIIMIVFGILVSVFALFASHHYAGPIYRFKRILEDIEKGDLTARAFLRDNDELNDLRESLNRAVKNIHVKLKLDKEKINTVISDLQKLRDELSSEHGESAGKILEIEKKLHEICGAFKL